ncbi:MAG: V-type ATP synthase subunit I [Roseburia sp.]
MIEKMKLLHITGPRQDIDRVMERYLGHYEIHFENAMALLNNLSDVRPFVENNRYREAYARAKTLWEELDGTVREKKPCSSPAEAEQIVNAAHQLTEETEERQKELRTRRRELTGLKEQLAPFRELDFDFHRILEFEFISFRFGRIPREYYQKLQAYMDETEYVLFYECHIDADYVWGAYFVPETYKTEADAVCLSFHFERIYLPDSFDGTPELAYTRAEQELRENEEEDAALRQKCRDELMRHGARLAGAYECLDNYCRNFDVRKLAACTKPKYDETSHRTEEYYILYGWMSVKEAKALLKEVKGDEQVYITWEEPEGNVSVKPPTKLVNPPLFKPFEMFVEMYGLPAYGEMDPTVFIALTYTLMFGIMFGDVGQGLCLLVGGFLLYRFKRMNLAAIISLAGVWSTVFGFLYGSVFGFEEWLSPVWMRPMDNIMTTLMLAIGFGMVLILIAMVLNIINAIRAKELGRLIFSQSGVAGLICYGCVAVCIVLYATGHALPATGILGAAVGIPLVAILFKEPLSNLIERRKHIFPEGSKAMFLVEALVELFDVVLSYATNSISFVRVGAFALSHAGMMGVVLTLAGYESGSPNILVVVLGNILVTGLEGLVVGIQVLRLEYYEMFSRFYSGTGKPFVAFSGSKERGGK